jgi:hypothetical protein
MESSADRPMSENRHSLWPARRREAWPAEVRFAADSPLEEAGFEPSVPGYGELGRIWARAIARSPGWLTWPLLLGERFPILVRVNRRLEHLLGAVRDLSGGLDWSTKIADHRDFLIRSEISLTANLNSRPEINRRQRSWLDSGHEAEAIIRSGARRQP